MRPRPLLACSLWHRALAPPPSGCFLLAVLQRPFDPDGAAPQFAAVQFEGQLDGVGALTGRQRCKRSCVSLASTVASCRKTFDTPKLGQTAS